MPLHLGFTGPTGGLFWAPALAPLVDIPDGVLDADVAARLGAPDQGRQLAVAGLLPGAIGILDVTVRQVQPARRYNRKRGGEGTMARVVLGDASGDIEMVLWDEETAHVAAGGPFQPGARLRVAGATVKAGYRGGLELGLGAARITIAAATPPELATLLGTLHSVGPTRIVGDRPSLTFQGDVAVLTVGGVERLVVAGPLLQQVRAVAPGAQVEFQDVQRHPAVDGWWLTTPATTLVLPGPPRNG
ncbi:MAG: SOSS complex subunit B family protein [bacterium]